MSSTKRLTREEQRERKALETEFLLSCKALGKELGWGFSKPTLFRRIDSWFVYITPGIYRDERKAHLSLSIKPFAIDDLLSRMMFGGGIPDKPLSRRTGGPLCLVVPIEYRDLPACGPLDLMLDVTRSFLLAAEEKARAYDLDNFIADHGEFDRRGHVYTNAVAARVLQGNLERARELVSLAIANAEEGNLGTWSPGWNITSFFQFADKWLEEERH